MEVQERWVCWFGDKRDRWSMQIVTGIWIVRVSMRMSMGGEGSLKLNGRGEEILK